MKMKVLVIGAAVVLAACGDVARPAAATVGGNKILVSVLRKRVDAFVNSAQFDQMSQQQDPEEVKRQYEQTLLGQLVRGEVLEIAAAEADVEVTEDELDERMEQVQGEFPSEAEFNKEVRRQGLTPSQVEELVRIAVLEEELREQVAGDLGATDKEVEAYYKENVDRFTEIRTAHVLVESNAEAIDIIDQLKDVPAGRVRATLGKLAKKRSIDTQSGQNGGDLGYFPVDQLVPEYTQAVDNLEEGDFTLAPVRSQFGFHVIYLIDRRAQPLEAVRDQLSQELGSEAQETAWNEFLRTAYEEADVEINPRFGELDLDTFTIVNVEGDSLPGGEAPEELPATPTDAPSPLG